MPAEIPTLTREAAWRRHQDQLGNLTSREESMIQRAFFAGWAAREQECSRWRQDAEWMATFIMGRLPDHNTMTPAEVEAYEQQLHEIVERVAAGIGKPASLLSGGQ